MAKRLFILWICIFQFLIGCSDSISDRLISPGSENEIKEIDIYNKTNKNFKFNLIKITSKNKIAKICYEVRNLEEINNVITKAQFGYYQVEFITIKNKIYSLDVIYTVYNGVVIDMGNRTYKNNSLESLILYFFQ